MACQRPAPKGNQTNFRSCHTENKIQRQYVHGHLDWLPTNWCSSQPSSSWYLSWTQPWRCWCCWWSEQARWCRRSSPSRATRPRLWSSGSHSYKWHATRRWRQWKLGLAQFQKRLVLSLSSSTCSGTCQDSLAMREHRLVHLLSLLLLLRLLLL